MKKEEIITLLTRIFIFLFVFLPTYIFLKDYPIRLLSVIIFVLITSFIIHIIYPKNKTTNLFETIMIGKMFGWGSLILSSFMLFGGLLAYIKDSEIPPTWALIVFGLLMSFSALFFYYSRE